MKRKLFLLLALMLTSISMWAYQTPTADGTYYLYNEETGMFMSRGATWGTRANVDNYGVPIKLAASGEKYVFTAVDRNTNGYGGQYWMYSDEGTAANRILEVIAVSDGNYKLRNNLWGTAEQYVYINAGGDAGFKNLLAGNSGDQAGLAEGMYLWKFLSQSERDEIIAAKIEANNIEIASTIGYTVASTSELESLINNTNQFASTNMTSSITSASLESSTSGWTYNKEANRNKNLASNTNGTECFEGCGTLTQTVSGLKQGLYKVTINGFHRDGANTACYSREYTDGYKAVSQAYLDANGYRGQIKSWASDATSNTAPNSMDAAKTLFNAGKYLTTVYTYVGSDGKLNLTIGFPAFNESGWYIFDNVTLTYYSDAVSDEDAAAILATANGLLSQEMDATIKTNLTNAKNTFDGARTIANYNALQTAVDAAQASADAYALFAPERTKALALGMSAEAIAALAPDVKALKVAEYDYVTTNYQYGVALGEWTSTGTNTSAATFNNEHWSGTTHDYKNQNDANGQGWNANSWSINFSQNVTLPAGSYVFKVAGRQAAGDQVTTSLVVKKGDDVLGTVNDFPRSNNSRGINKSGATAFDGDASNFANNGNGFGWEWRYVKFELADPATVNIAVNSVATAIHQWVSFGDYTLQTNNEDNVDLMEALVALNDAKTAATLTKNTTNVGTGVFQLDEDTNDNLWGEYEDAKTDADNFTLTASSTADAVNDLATALNTAISNYQNQPLNAPDAEKRYWVSIVEDGKAWDGNAVTFIAGGRSGEGDYAIKYLTTSNANFCQAIKLTATTGNKYKMSVVRADDGKEQYLTTNNLGQYGSNKEQIRTTNDASKALEVEIKATSNNGEFQLYNTDANAIIANNNNNDMYTAGSANFTIAEASQATPNLTIAAGVNWATFMSPFAVSLNDLDKVSAYKITGVDGDAFTTEEVTTTIPANTPVLLYRKTTGSNYSPSLTGWGTAAAETYDEGLLTGFYTKTAVTASANHYLLQKNNDVVAFYHVATEGLYIGAYRAYLTNNSNNEARPAFFFPEDGDFTGINAVEAVEANDGALKDGKYLIGNKIVLVKNGVKFGANGQKLN